MFGELFLHVLFLVCWRTYLNIGIECLFFYHNGQHALGRKLLSYGNLEFSNEKDPCPCCEICYETN